MIRNHLVFSYIMIAIGQSVLKCMDNFCGTLLRIITCKASSAELCCEQSLAKRPLRNFAANNHLQSVLCETLLRTITCKASSAELCCEQSLAKRPLRNFAANNHLQSVLCGTLLRTITCKASSAELCCEQSLAKRVASIMLQMKLYYGFIQISLFCYA